MFSAAGGRDLPNPVQRPFPKDTLIHNWQEDRHYADDDVPYQTMLQKSHARQPETEIDLVVPKANCSYPLAPLCRLQRYTQNQPHSSRTIPVDFPNKEDPRTLDYVTTKDKMDANIGETLKPKPQPCMIMQGTMGSVYMDRATKSKVPFGTLLKAETRAPTDYTTTNKNFYVNKPEQDLPTKPATYWENTQGNGLGGILDRDVLDHTSCPVQGGRAGARGPMSRHPGKDGSIGGPSVFVDEYAEASTVTMRETLQAQKARAEAS